MIRYVASTRMAADDKPIVPDGAVWVDGHASGAVDAAVRAALDAGADEVRVIDCRITEYLCRQLAAGRVWFMAYKGLTLRHMLERHAK